MTYVLRTTAAGMLGLSTPKSCTMRMCANVQQVHYGYRSFSASAWNTTNFRVVYNSSIVPAGGIFNRQVLNTRHCVAITPVRTNMNQRRRNMKKQMESQKQKKLAAEARLAKLERLQQIEALVEKNVTESEKQSGSVQQHPTPSHENLKSAGRISTKASESMRRAVPKQQAPAASDVKDMRLMRVGIGRLIDPYIPLEPVQRPSLFSTDGLKYRWNHIKKTLRSLVGVAVIKRKKIPFQAMEFAEDAQVQFVQAMYALQADDKLALRNTCTDDTALQLRADYRKKNKFSWDFIRTVNRTLMIDALGCVFVESFFSSFLLISHVPACFVVADQVERPRVIHTSTFAVGEKGQEQYFAQVTVRFHTKQAINGETRDMVDYVVFERFLEAAMDGKWLMCGKVKPPQSWAAMQ